MYRFVFFLLFPVFSLPVFSQVKVEYKQTAEFYIKNILLGPGVEVGNIKHVGMIGGLGQFEADSAILGVKSGLILSTGHVDSIQGPNSKPSYTSEGVFPESKELLKALKKGDKDLKKLCRSKTTDITVIEFDFVPQQNVLEFRYVFASDEYPEYAGSMFNDVFGFFIKGPGIKKSKSNLAVLPDKKQTPITINNVNHYKNSEYYRGSSHKKKWLKKLFMSKAEKKDLAILKSYLEFDGLTTVLTVHCDVIPYRKYHMKIAIGDVGDRIYDSAVFLEAGSFTSVEDTSGKYFPVLEKIKEQPPNIDSVLKAETITDTITEKEIDEKFEITDIYFASDSYVISDSAKTQLDLLIGYLEKNKDLQCNLFGYTDIKGSKKYNQSLSEKRAMAVKQYLTAKGISENRLNDAGFSFENPKNDNSTEQGRARNRRVEIVLEISGE
ncbi:MAG: choice-of-anchor L domain-containing protein [Bacteroidota bacterium]